MTVANQQCVETQDMLILVDDSDHEIGFCPKDECHQGTGQLHRAFSVFLFNENGQLLLQQRSEKKHLWPGYWSNSCCSHPRQGERIEDAAYRRVREELGAGCELEFLYKFQYQAQFNDTGAENELCSVFTGRLTGEVAVNPDEIADFRYVFSTTLTDELATNGSQFTPWIKLEWDRLREDFADKVFID